MARVATQGEPQRGCRLPSARFTGSGQVRSRAEAYSTRPFCSTITMTALRMAAAMQRLTKVPTVLPAQESTTATRSPVASWSAESTPRQTAATGTVISTTPASSDHRTVRATLRRGSRRSSER